MGRSPAFCEQANHSQGNVIKNPGLPVIDLETANTQLRDLPPEEIVRWALNLGKSTITTTSFGPNSGAILHLLSQVDKGIPVVWVDSGYNMRDTYVVAEQLIKRLELNTKIYVPSVTAEHLNVRLGGIPTLDDPDLHDEFTRVVKLEPFSRALSDLNPSVWISGIRQGDTDFRRNLDILSYDNRGILKVAPIFYWSDEQLEDYMEEHDLPSCKHYFDPTKVESGRECGLHTSA